jgi:hypothetical protein
MTDDGVKPVPVTTIVNGFIPAGTDAGEMALT